ncbi:hypothetical protein PHJA_000836200 [Phtheirospermum japonicum]|uniref:Pectinesterase inhibitor domain-containing protein n=1 Tax=Phtheirospermum japonicum TaxID=374723 RepID=A0A830BR21_9LAMI|nr:hypothetical protein PHJA_000836200 [Phtheirospermum japonicum]
MSNIIVTSSSNNFIEQACSNPRLGSKSKSCIQILGSQPNIVSAKNLYDMSLAIMQSGISSTTNTRAYIENLLKNLLSKTGPNEKGALQDCKESYDSIILSFKSALSEVRDDKEYQTATYDLLIASTDTFKPCLDDVVAGKIKDGTILNGNDLTLIYLLSAYQAVNSIPEEGR